ncbi:MAG: tetratricopeptide repeat protein [Chlamydiae bacterium]|nr:tetratricopeptide repeat protein [Chlamydiota bacterium]MBI3276158.1 tetratricopeptide repeat protein [Chlamydiota bacterium]
MKRIFYSLFIGIILFFESGIEGHSSEMNSEAKATFDRAFTLIEKGNLEEAKTLYEKTIQLAPESQDAWLEYTSCLRKCHHLQRAVRAGWRAVELGQDSSSVWTNLGNVFLDANAWNSASDAFKKVQILSEDRKHVVQNFLNLGFRQWIFGDSEAALKTFNEALKLNSSNGQTLLDISAVLLSQQKLEEGLHQIHEAILTLQNEDNKRGLIYAENVLDIMKDEGVLIPPLSTGQFFQNLPEPFLKQPVLGTALGLKIEDEVKYTIPVSFSHKVLLKVPELWEIDVTEGSRQEPGTITFQPKKDDQFKLMLSFMVSKKNVLEIQETVRKNGEESLKESVETQLSLIQIESDSFHGCAYFLTDRSLVGKEPKENDYPYLIQGIGKAGDVDVFFTVLSRFKDEKFVNEMLEKVSKICSL